jgi:hypothetical protein
LAHELEKARVGTLYRVHVIVTSVNPIEGLVDLALVEIETGPAPKMQKSPHRKSTHKRKRGGRHG